jgi:hypothetical protein
MMWLILYGLVGLFAARWVNIWGHREWVEVLENRRRCYICDYGTGTYRCNAHDNVNIASPYWRWLPILGAWLCWPVFIGAWAGKWGCIIIFAVGDRVGTGLAKGMELAVTAQPIRGIAAAWTWFWQDPKERKRQKVGILPKVRRYNKYNEIPHFSEREYEKS